MIASRITEDRAGDTSKGTIGTTLTTTIKVKILVNNCTTSTTSATANSKGKITCNANDDTPRTRGMTINGSTRVSCSGNAMHPSHNSVTMNGGTRVGGCIGRNNNVTVKRGTFSRGVTNMRRGGFGFKRAAFAKSKFLKLRSPFVPTGPSGMIANMTVKRGTCTHSNDIVINARGFGNGLCSAAISADSVTGVHDGGMIIGTAAIKAGD